jgi:regulator of replication initiation timing
MATIIEMITQMDELKSQLQANKTKSSELVREHKALAVLSKHLRLKIQELLIQIRTQKTTDKLSVKETKLAELLAAKEEAARLGVTAYGRKTVDNSMPQAAAAHRSVDELLQGNLDEEVESSDLDMF